MTTTANCYEHFNPAQTLRVTDWLSEAEDVLINVYESDNVSTASARSRISAIERHNGLTHTHSMELDSVALALLRASQAFAGEYDRNEGVMHLADAQSRLAGLIVTSGRPAVRLLRICGKLQGALAMQELAKY